MPTRAHQKPQEPRNPNTPWRIGFSAPTSLSSPLTTKAPKPPRIRCEKCGRLRREKFYLTRSGNLTKVCDECRENHAKEVKLSDPTALTARAMDMVIFCEKCGKPIPLRGMLKHLYGTPSRRGCIKTRLYDIPGIRPPGVLAENT